MEKVRIKIVTQCFFKGGGPVLPAGRIFDLDEDRVAELPAQSYEIVGPVEPATPAQKQTTPPADKQVTGGRRKRRRKRKTKGAVPARRDGPAR